MTDKELPIEPGWYIPALPAEPGFWNPYLLTSEGDWLEMQSDGHTKRDPEDVFTPLHRLVQVPLHPTSNASLLAEAAVDYKSYGPHALGKRLAAALEQAEFWKMHVHDNDEWEEYRAYKAANRGGLRETAALEVANRKDGTND